MNTKKLPEFCDPALRCPRPRGREAGSGRGVQDHARHAVMAEAADAPDLESGGMASVRRVEHPVRVQVPLTVPF